MDLQTIVIARHEAIQFPFFWIASCLAMTLISLTGYCYVKLTLLLFNWYYYINT